MYLLHNNSDSQKLNLARTSELSFKATSTGNEQEETLKKSQNKQTNK